MRSGRRLGLSGCPTLVAALALVGCTHGAGSATDGASASAAPAEDPSAPLSEARAKGIVIATLQTHDKKVQILGRPIQIANGTTDPDSLRVVVWRNDGALLADGLTVAELHAADPMVHALVTSALASAQSGTFLDATLHERPAPTFERTNLMRRDGVTWGGPRLLDPSR